MSYEEEISRPTLKATVTVGARPGYSETTTPFTLEHVTNQIGEISRKIDEGSTSLKSLPAIVHEGKLIGRTGNGSYREDVYVVDFMLSPRDNQVGCSQFDSAVWTYARELGAALQQERVYVEMNGRTTVLKKSSKSHRIDA